MERGARARSGGQITRARNTHVHTHDALQCCLGVVSGVDAWEASTWEGGWGGWNQMEPELFTILHHHYT